MKVHALAKAIIMICFVASEVMYLGGSLIIQNRPASFNSVSHIAKPTVTKDEGDLSSADDLALARTAGGAAPAVLNPAQTSLSLYPMAQEALSLAMQSANFLLRYPALLAMLSILGVIIAMRPRQQGAAV